mmetsp:Transcript_11968/g.27728  ORF Transcript_11968/g.27728 Transcript_11968/m.27728 type:complete len:239 (-) Transcript_11968:399-1115(-)
MRGNPPVEPSEELRRRRSFPIKHAQRVVPPAKPPGVASVKLINSEHLRVGEVEVEEAGVVEESPLRARLRYDGRSLLQRPAQQDLRGAHVVVRGGSDDRRRRQERATERRERLLARVLPAEGRVRLHDNPLASTVLEELLLRIKRVHLHLVDCGRPYRRGALQRLEVADGEVGDADGSDLPRAERVLHRAPGGGAHRRHLRLRGSRVVPRPVLLHQVLPTIHRRVRRAWPMHQPEIDV